MKYLVRASTGSTREIDCNDGESLPACLRRHAGQTPSQPTPGLGDMVKAGLSAIGITEDRVSRLVGKPCGCSKRAAAMNAFGHKYLGLPPGSQNSEPATHNGPE